MHLLVSENKTNEWIKEADWRDPLEDFHRHERHDLQECSDIAQNLNKAIPVVFSRKMDGAKVHQCKHRPGESIFDYLERLEKPSNSTLGWLLKVLRIIKMIQFSIQFS